MKPEYEVWAEQLLQDIYYTPEHLRAALVTEHLLKAVKRGYLDGTDSGWIAVQEAAPQRCLHRNTYSTLSAINPTLTCMVCGERLK